MFDGVAVMFIGCSFLQQPDRLPVHLKGPRDRLIYKYVTRLCLLAGTHMDRRSYRPTDAPDRQTDRQTDRTKKQDTA